MSNFIKDFFSSLVPNDKDYLIYHSGRRNLIISVPHSGSIKPINIPTRKYGNKSKDSYTMELIEKILQYIPTRPYYIYSRIHRSKIDFNRDVKEACQDNLKMEHLWNVWNNTLHDYINTVRFYYKKGLYIDLHSHNNSDKFQIGYGLPVKDYLILLDNKKIPTKNSTMHPLKEYDSSEYISEHSVLFGEYSIPHNLETFGYQVLIPKNDDDYLNGGRNIKTFTGNGIGSMQIECPIPILKNDLDGVAKALVSSIEIFSKKFLVKI